MAHINNLKMLYWDIVQELLSYSEYVDYYESIDSENAENKITELCIKYNIVDQDWFDARLKHDAIHRYCDIILVLGSYFTEPAIQPEKRMFINTKKE